MFICSNRVILVLKKMDMLKFNFTWKTKLFLAFIRMKHQYLAWCHFFQYSFSVCMYQCCLHGRWGSIMRVRLENGIFKSNLTWVDLFRAGMNLFTRQQIIWRFMITNETTLKMLILCPQLHVVIHVYARACWYSQ